MLFFLLGTSLSNAQQQAQFTQYMYNPFSINPAFTGYRNTLNVVAMHRSQWIGIDNSPTSQTIAIQSPLKDGKNGIGLDIYNDELYPGQSIGASANYSYTIEMGKSNFAFGVKAGAKRFSLDYSNLTLENQTDESFESIRNKFTPQIGLGFLLYNEKYFVGISTPNVYENTYAKKRLTDNTLYEVVEKTNFYIMGGYQFDVSPTLQFKPTTLIKAVSGAPVQIDVSANFMYNKLLTLGVAYRYEAAASGLIGYQVSRDFMVGLAYDYDLTELSNYNKGSAEVMLRYELFNKGINKRILNPRIF